MSKVRLTTSVIMLGSLVTMKAYQRQYMEVKKDNKYFISSLFDFTRHTVVIICMENHGHLAIPKVDREGEASSGWYCHSCSMKLTIFNDFIHMEHKYTPV